MSKASGKQFAAAVSLLCCSTAIASTPVDIGGIPISIPSPHGFTEVTPRMSAIWQIVQAGQGANHILEFYIPEAEQKTALTGKQVSLDRNINVQVTRNLEGRVLTSNEFSQIEKRTESMIALHQTNTVETKAIERVNGNLAKLFGSDPNLSQERNLSLPVHLNETNEFSFSEISTEQITMPDGKLQQAEVTVTTIAILVKGKMLMCYVTGAANDLNWTRLTAKEWAGSIVAANRISH